jgi:hypothetical protein
MGAPILLCGSGAWKLQNRDWERIQAAEIKYLKNVKVPLGLIN